MRIDEGLKRFFHKWLPVDRFEFNVTIGPIVWKLFNSENKKKVFSVSEYLLQKTGKLLFTFLVIFMRSYRRSRIITN